LLVINLAGVSVPRVLLPELAEHLIYGGFNATASKLLSASSNGDSGVDLTESERHEILAVLAEPPPGLEELCRELRKAHAADATAAQGLPAGAI
jgi:hypothetical protein